VGAGVSLGKPAAPAIRIARAAGRSGPRVLPSVRIGDYSGREVPLYLKIFHPRFEDLFFIGLFQGQGCIWPLADWQGKLVARALLGAWKRPADMDAAIRRELEHPDWAFTDSLRHAVEVDYHDFRKRLVMEVEGGRAF